MEFLTNLCVGFSWDKLAKCDQEYLYEMYRTMKYANKCPITNEDMETLYPNRGNFKFFTDSVKLEKYINSSSKRNEVYASHLLDSVKYFMVWTCDHLENTEES